jgi:glycosyltransferase involved in cell wall biosynthesis
MVKKVSVVIPVYNRPEGVQRAVVSVLQQTMQDFEIILVDDCSNDGTTVAVAETCVMKHPDKIRLLRHTKNKGVSAARNTGITVATGEYVALLDSDDEWLPQKLEKQIALLESHPEKTTLLCLCNLDVVEKETGYKTGTYQVTAGDDFPVRFLGLEILNPCSVMLVSRATMNKVGPFDETMNVSEDVDWLLRHVIAGGSITSTVEALSIYKSEIGKTYHENARMLDLVFRRYGKIIRQQFGFHAYRHFVSGINHHQFRGAKRRKQYLKSLYHLMMVGVSPTRFLELAAGFVGEKFSQTKA